MKGNPTRTFNDNEMKNHSIVLRIVIFSEKQLQHANYTGLHSHGHFPEWM